MRKRRRRSLNNSPKIMHLIGDRDEFGPRQADSRGYTQISFYSSYLPQGACPRYLASCPGRERRHWSHRCTNPRITPKQAASGAAKPQQASSVIGEKKMIIINHETDKGVTSRLRLWWKFGTWDDPKSYAGRLFPPADKYNHWNEKDCLVGFQGNLEAGTEWAFLEFPQNI